MASPSSPPISETIASPPASGPSEVFERLAAHRQMLSRLAHSEALSGRDIAAAYAQVTELAAAMLRVARVGVWRFDSSRRELVCVDAFEAQSGRHQSGARLSADERPNYFRALERERCIVATDAQTDPLTSEFSAEYLEPLGIGALLDAPIWVRGTVVGVVCHEHVGGPRRFRFEEELIAGTMADFVARVIEASLNVRTERELGLYRDHVSELTRVEQGIRRSEENLRLLLSAAPVALVLTRLRDDRVLLANDRAARLLGLELSNVVGQSARVHFSENEEFSRLVERLQQDGEVEEQLMSLRRHSGEPFWATVSARLLSQDGESSALMGLHDVTEQKKLEERLRALATLDPLTGAANRRHFAEVAGRERERSRRQKSPLSVCMLDADHFKSVNDVYGHASGDRVLCAIARAARSALRQTDLLGRLGGEEFGILLPDTDLAGALSVAERVRRGVESAEVASAEGEKIAFTVSVGAAQLHGDEQFGALLRRADQALYAAKEAGRNRTQAG